MSAENLVRFQSPKDDTFPDANLRDFLETAAIAMHWVGAEGTILWANRTELDLLGYTPDEYIGRSISEFHADKEVIDEILRRLHAGEELRDFEARLRCKDGSIKHVLINSNVLWEDEKFVHTRCFTRDITDRRRAEEALRRQTDLFATLVEHIPDIVSRLDRDLRFLYISPAVRAVTGRPAHEYIGKPRTNEGLSPEFAETRDYLSRRVLETGQEQRLEFPIQTRRGERLLECRFIPEFAPDGTVESLMTLTRDITERKNTEDALRASEAQLEAELEDMKVLQSVSARLIHEENLEALYEHILDAAVAIMHADYGSMQTFSSERGPHRELKLLSHRGFTPEAAHLWEWVSSVGKSSCAEASRTLERVIVTDTESCEFMAESRDLDGYRAYGIKAMQSTPLISRGGKLLGMLSTHWREPHQPAEHRLRLIDVLARQAADLMERSQSDAALRESEERYRSLVSVITDVPWTTDATGAFATPQRDWERYTGQPWEEHRGFGWSRAIHPEDREQTRIIWDRACASGTLYESNCRIWNARSQQWRHIVARATPRVNSDGSVKEWVGTCTDVDDAKRAEKEREDARQTAELLNRVGPAIHAELDTQKLTQTITDIATELTTAQFGSFFYNVSDEQGESPTFTDQAVVRSADIAKDPRYGKNSPYHGVPAGHLPVRSYLAVPVISRSGRVLGGLFFGHQEEGVFTEQHERLAVGIAAQAAIALDNAHLFAESREVQERLIETNAALRRANADLEQFAYSASHDLQEPIRSVVIYGELLTKHHGHVFDARGKEFLSFMTGGAKRMNMLVKDLLAYTQSANMESEPPESVDANAALEKAVAGLRAAIEETQAAVTSDRLPILRAREVQLQQLFQNLISNAIKYRTEGEAPCIHVSAESKGGEWLFSVRDNGIGIEPEYRERIFGIFKRLHTDGKYSGTGIGLAICQKIVERNGGRIWVDSGDSEKGSTFYFTLPAGLT